MPFPVAIRPAVFVPNSSFEMCPLNGTTGGVELSYQPLDEKLKGLREDCERIASTMKGAWCHGELPCSDLALTRKCKDLFNAKDGAFVNDIRRRCDNIDQAARSAIQGALVTLLVGCALFFFGESSGRHR